MHTWRKSLSRKNHKNNLKYSLGMVHLSQEGKLIYIFLYQFIIKINEKYNRWKYKAWIKSITILKEKNNLFLKIRDTKEYYFMRARKQSK